MESGNEEEEVFLEDVLQDLLVVILQFVFLIKFLVYQDEMFDDHLCEVVEMIARYENVWVDKDWRLHACLIVDKYIGRAFDFCKFGNQLTKVDIIYPAVALLLI